MKISLAEDASRRATRRVQRHGYEYDLVLEHFMEGKPAGKRKWTRLPAPFGLLLKSHKTGKYVWFDRKQLLPISFYDGKCVPDIIEGVKTYTPDKNLLREYLDHVMSNVFSKRDQKK